VSEEWNGLESTRPFVAQVEEVLGEAQEPDPLFFVESWTLGVAPATESLLRRRQMIREQAAPGNHSLDSFLPFLRAEEAIYGVERPDSAEISVGSVVPLTGGYGFNGLTVSSEIDAESEQNPEPQWGADFGKEYESESGGAAAAEPLARGPVTLEGACRVLGVAASSTREQIKAAYRRMASRHHPDRLGRRTEEERLTATERMVSINEAYRLLCGMRLRESA
jgi:DnaJ-domain-containing protein 1